MLSLFLFFLWLVTLFRLWKFHINKPSTFEWFEWWAFLVLRQDIIRLPRLFRFLQRPLAKLISVLRAPKSKEGYAAIGGGSPLRKITDDQVEFNFLVFPLYAALCFSATRILCWPFSRYNQWMLCLLVIFLELMKLLWCRHLQSKRLWKQRASLQMCTWGCDTGIHSPKKQFSK